MRTRRPWCAAPRARGLTEASYALAIKPVAHGAIVRYHAGRPGDRGYPWPAGDCETPPRVLTPATTANELNPFSGPMMHYNTA